MKKTLFVFCFVFLATLPVFSQSNPDESMTITTYYPSPYGSYESLQAKRLAMGDRNNDGKLTDADQPLNDGQLYMGRGVIYQPLNPLPASGTPGELAYNASADAFYYYNASGSWVPFGGGSAGKCYVSYASNPVNSQECLPGFTNKGSAGTWGLCYDTSSGPGAGSNFRWPGTGCLSGYTLATIGEAFLCCQ
jgi:hypothetical protein